MSDLVKRLADALQRLADAADEVGVKHFDDDSLSSEVEAMQSATLDARFLLRECTAAERGEAQPVAWLVMHDGQMIDAYAGDDKAAAIRHGYEESQLVTAYAAPPAAPEGFVLVPKEPTEEMVEAAREVKRQRLLKAVNETKAGREPNTMGLTMAVTEEWSAMLAAAPTPGVRG